MIQIYAPNETNFNVNSNTVLLPTICEVTAQVNGVWELTLEHAIDDEGRWKEIVDGAVLKVPSFNGTQLFRIKQTDKQDSGVTATAEPIFMDSIGDCFLIDVRPTNVSGQTALTRILSPNSKYTGVSNISKINTAYYMLKNAIEAITDDDNGFITRWGGEIEYDNYTIKINETIGQDNGVELLYAKNIAVNGLTESISVDEVVTRIIPKAYNGHRLQGNSPWIDSPLINAYPTIHTKVVEYDYIRLASDMEDEEDTSGLIICENMTQLYQALTEATRKEYEKGIDKPTVTITCDMVLLENTEEYKDYKAFEKVSLGDVIHCKHSRLDIETDARVVELTYNCITESVTYVTIGAVERNFMNRVASVVNASERALTKDGEVRAGNIQGIIDGANARIVAQAKNVEAQRERVILFEDLNPASSTFGAMALGTTGFVISNTRNADDTDWVWTTFGTGAGFSADLIVAGTLQAISILGGTITGTSINNGNGTFEVSSTGVLKASSAEITGDIKSGSTITGSTISGGEVNGALIKTGGSGQAGQFESYYDNDYLAVRIQGGRYNVYSPNESGVHGGYITGYGSGATAGLRINGKTGGGVRIGTESQEYFRADDSANAVYLLGKSATAGQNVAFLRGQNRQLTLYAPVGIYLNPANNLYIHNGSNYVKGYTGTKNGVQFVNGIAVG